MSEVLSTDQVLNNNQDFSEAIVSSSSNISQSIRGLESVITSASESLKTTMLSVNDGMTWDTFVFAIAVAFIGALSAFLFNYFHWVVVREKEYVSGIGGDLLELIEKIELLSLKYWVSDASNMNAGERHVSEVLMKSLLRQINSHIDLFLDVLKKDVCSKEKEGFSVFRSDIYDLVTGNGFESVERKASKSTASKISTKCSKIRIKISRIIVK